ncbi:unnamed protein product [Ostreobium quekettii]|uniref:Uncharacterized protein n=1 Tax=Ostreobium quekettii TaxID=121088 RepID=A0A8S1IXD3_9CHLO|nr:unnamed protein product [Ostreobium quekettii]
MAARAGWTVWIATPVFRPGPKAAKLLFAFGASHSASMRSCESSMQVVHDVLYSCMAVVHLAPVYMFNAWFVVVVLNARANDLPWDAVFRLVFGRETSGGGQLAPKSSPQFLFALAHPRSKASSWQRRSFHADFLPAEGFRHPWV